MTFNALLQATKQSLHALKERVCTRAQVGGGPGAAAGVGFLFVQRPFFEVGVQLAIPTVALTPSLKELQRCINKVAAILVRCTSSVCVFFFAVLLLDDDDAACCSVVQCSTRHICVWSMRSSTEGPRPLPTVKDFEGKKKRNAWCNANERRMEEE